MNWYSDKPWTPSCEELAAYARGALDGCAGSFLRRRIETWLAAHPEEAAEVELQRRLARLMETTSPPAPAESQWEALWDRIQAAPPADSQPSTGRGQRLGWMAVLLSAAAALLLAVWAPWEHGWAPSPEVVEPFPVVTQDEVEILRMDGDDADVLAVGRPPVADTMSVAVSREVEIVRVNGADTDALVVGELPVHGPLVLAEPGDVSLKRMDPGAEVRMGNQDMPVVWARLDTDAEK
jgi:hypothetical protein